MLGAGGQKRVPDLYVKDFEAAWPPTSIQVTIATYLDAEVARIDALSAAKRYGVHTFDWAARVKPAAMAANCPQPARMVLGPGGL